MLENHAHALTDFVDVGLRVVDLDIIKPYLARCRRFQQIEAAQEGTLAAAGRPDQYNLLPFLYFIIDSAQNMILPEILVQILDADHCCITHDFLSSIN